MDVYFDQAHLWHPYSQIPSHNLALPVIHAEGVYLTLADGRKLIDGMASWWACIHGYNQPQLNQAIKDQVDKMAHVMFGGLTHQPAIDLGKKLVAMTADSLRYIFFADSGSVGVEVAMKMAAQYCFEQGLAGKNRFMTFKQGYHGDTFGAMSVCDPVNGMHHKFSHLLQQPIFIESPQCGYSDQWHDYFMDEFEKQLKLNHESIIAVIFEPVVQGAGGMRFYHPNYLKAARDLCDRYNVLLIFDEIATGFGRTGELFAYQHAQVVPDILILGKALTAGYMSLAAVITCEKIAHGINQPFMHGPTFMANPLACSVAAVSISLLLESPWQNRIEAIERQLQIELAECNSYPVVKAVRVLGAIGVVELNKIPDWLPIQRQLVEAGVWLRPFKNLLYLMPPYIITVDQLAQVTTAIKDTLRALK